MLTGGSYIDDLYLLCEIASGGMGVIWAAYDLAGKRLLALKTVLTHLSEDEQFTLRLKREASVYALLDHPNVIRLVDDRTSNDPPYFLMEFIHGTTLYDLLQDSSGFPLHEALKITLDLCGALLLAHAKGVVHRDLQPRNVLISTSGMVKLFDFGIARADDDILHTITGTIMGTTLYASPEQNQGKDTDERSDIYSLGLMLYEMLTGRRAIEENDLHGIVHFKLREAYVPPREYNERIPPRLEAFVMRMLRKEPEERPASIREVMDEMLDLLPEESESRALEEAKRLHARKKTEQMHELLLSLEETPAARTTDYLWLRAECHRLAGDAAEARRWYERLVMHPEAKDEHLVEYAIFMQSVGEGEEALRALGLFKGDRLLDRIAAALSDVFIDERAGVMPSRSIRSKRADGGRSDSVTSISELFKGLWRKRDG